MSATSVGSRLVSIIIVNWNGLHWLKMCLPSLSKISYSPVEIIVVDNASTDGSVHWLKKTYPYVKIIVNDRNLGFADANNAGYAAVRGVYVLLLNNDVTVRKNFLTELVRKIESSPDIAGAQGKMLLMDDSSRLDAAGAYLTPTGFLLHWGFGKKDAKKYDETQDVYTTKGACMIVKTSVLRDVEIGGKIFDPDYFAYFEESDLCHRILLTGKRMVYAPQSVIYHKMGGTSTGMNNAFIQFHSFKNRIRTYLKNLEFLNIIFIMPIHLAMCEFFSAVSLLKGKFDLSWSVQRAVWWNIRKLPATLRIRREIQNRIRKVPDAAYFRKVMKNPSFRYYINLSAGKSSDEA